MNEGDDIQNTTVLLYTPTEEQLGSYTTGTTWRTYDALQLIQILLK